MPRSTSCDGAGRVTHSEPETAPAPTANPAEVAVDRAALQQALDSLNGRERELVALKFFAGLSNAEIATVTHTSESNAGTRLHRVIEKLRRSIDEAD